MRALLDRLFDHESLSREEARETLKEIAAQTYPPAQVASFLTAFRMRSITVSELQGFRNAMLDLCTPVDLSEYDALDLCGTGGDGKDTFNISTLSAFVVAGSGVNVAKHGNNGVSSVCGSSNVLLHLGANFTADIDTLKRCLDKAGICYLHAPLFHPAMKHVAPIRRELRIRTFFNMLGPLVNPSRPKRQLIGVFNLELARLYTYLLQQEEMDFTIAHSLDGYDEISLTGPCKIHSALGEQLLTPRDMGFSQLAQEDLYGGEDVASSAKIFMNVLQGEGTQAQQDVVVANAGMAIHCARPTISRTEAFETARETLLSKRALHAFTTFVEESQKAP